MDKESDKPTPNEIYEQLIRQHAVGDEMAIPSIKDALPFLKIHEDVDFQTIIRQQYVEIGNTAKQFKVSKINSSRAITFIIPLMSYIPLPKPYTAVTIGKLNMSKKHLESFNCVRIEDYLPRLSDNDDVLLKLSYAIVTVCDSAFGVINTKIEQNTNLLEMHNQAIQALNHVIDAYKATPMRHNHLLQPITQLGAPGETYVLVSNTKHGHIMSQQKIDLHEHLFGEIFAARNMAPDELAIFQEIHTRYAFDEGYPLKLVKKLNEAIDARCIGRHESSIVLADLYAEQSMSYWLYRIFLEKGISEVDAKKKSRGFKEITNLKNTLATELGILQSDFDKKINYNRWYQKCRETRNGLSHDFMFAADNNKMSYDAVQESASIIKCIAEISVNKYPNLERDGRIFRASTWMLDRIKHGVWEKQKQ
jgi:hypothetical protein